MRGRRAIPVAPVSPFADGDKVSLRIENKLRWGWISKIKRHTATVKLKDGDGMPVVVKLADPTLLHRCKTKGCANPGEKGKDSLCGRCKANLVHHGDMATRDELDRATKERGTYPVTWDKELTKFKFNVKDKRDPDDDKFIHFYGWWRKAVNMTNGKAFFALDIFAKRAESDVTVDTIKYEKDPRKNMAGLNADLCAASNKWLFTWFTKNAVPFDQIVKLAQRPTIRVNRLETLDNIISRFMEFRATAIHCGGTRLMELTGDKEEDPTMFVQVNVTPQALALEGKVPKLRKGSAYDVVLDPNVGRRRKGGEPETRNRSSGAAIPVAGNVADLVSRLKSSTDPVEKRNIRAALRKMGHRGGARSNGKE